MVDVLKCHEPPSTMTWLEIRSTQLLEAISAGGPPVGGQPCRCLTSIPWVIVAVYQHLELMVKSCSRDSNVQRGSNFSFDSLALGVSLEATMPSTCFPTCPPRLRQWAIWGQLHLKALLMPTILLSLLPGPQRVVFLSSR